MHKNPFFLFLIHAVLIGYIFPGGAKAQTESPHLDHANQINGITLLTPEKNNVTETPKANNAPLESTLIHGVGDWSLTGNLTDARRDHSAVLLRDGRVLVVNGTSSTPEIYDPISSSFSTLPDMAFFHGQGATATLLEDGRVLIVGGSPTSVRRAAQIFNPRTNTFSVVGLTNVGHAYHSATLLDDGRVLIAAGRAANPDSSHSFAEIFDPQTEQFSLTGNLVENRTGHGALLLPDGRVLITGGSQTTTAGFARSLNSVEIYDPQLGTFQSIGAMSNVVGGNDLILLPNNRVLIISAFGGQQTEFFDPQTNSFSQTGANPLLELHLSGANAVLSNRLILITGGAKDVGPVTSNTAELYDPATGEFSLTAPMLSNRQQHTMTLLNDGRILAIGGYNGSVDVNTAELYTFAGIAPVIISSPSTEIIAGEQFVYDMEATGLPFPTYQLLNGPAEMTIDEATGIIAWTPTESGSFFVSAQASNGVGQPVIQTFTIDVSTLTSPPLSVETNLIFDDLNQQSSFRLVSLPGDLNIDIASTLQGTRGDAWSVFYDDGSEEDYFKPYDGSSRFRFQPGRGFWLLSREPWQVQEPQVEGVELEVGGHFAITLQNPGWNIISSPFNTDVSWARVLNANPDLPQSAVIHRFDGGFNITNSMTSNEAYYFFNNQASGARLLIPDPDFSTSKSSGENRLDMFSLSVIGEDSSASSAHIFLHPDAQNTLDPYDQYAPRNDFSKRSIHLVSSPNEEQNNHALAIEARPRIGQGQRFELELIAEPKPQRLKVEGEDLFGNAELYLLEKATSRLTNLRDAREVVLYPTSTRSRYALLVGPPGYIDDVHNKAVPEEHHLLPNYPNPFSETTTIEYALPEEGEIFIQVYDALGREVASLVDGTRQEAGLHRVTWNTRQAQPLPQGLYFVRMITNTGQNQTISIVKIK